jgi:2,3-bisphosphoglycerate-independent phosphoglycerate mutase
VERMSTLSTVSGRYYAMDRDRRWARTARAYDAIVHAVGERAPDGPAAIAAAYARDETDEFIAPTVIGSYRGMADGDVVIHLNFRADRARQLTHALADADFSRFDRGRRPHDLMVVTLTEYQAPAELPVTVAFGPLVIDSLAAHLARLGKRQLHVAETEKYAHVTYFFNGGVEDELPGEDRILIPSNREVPTYDLAPEMRAEPITDAVVSAIATGSYDFIVANYANPDMVGHTGVWEAAVHAAEVIDACLGRLDAGALAANATLVITADHGNIEEMRDAEGRPQTKHTTSPVPLVLVDPRHAGATLRDGALSDLAPTLCELLGIPPGPEMTGTSLLRGG